MIKIIALLFPVVAYGLGANKTIDSAGEILIRPANYVEVYSDLKLMANNELRLLEASGSDYVSLKSAASLGSILNFILPASYGTSGDCIQGDGAGVLSFAPCAEDFAASIQDQQIAFGTGPGVGSGKGTLLFDYSNNELELKGSMLLSGDVSGSGTGAFGQVVSQNNVTGSGTGSFGNVVSQGNLYGSGSGEFSGKIIVKSQNPVELQDSSGGEYARVRAHATTTSHTVTLPANVCASGQVWSDDGSGNMSCVDQSGGGGGDKVFVSQNTFDTDASLSDVTCTTGSCSISSSTPYIDRTTKYLAVSLSAQTANVRGGVANTAWVNKNLLVKCAVKSSLSDLYLCAYNGTTDENCTLYDNQGTADKVVTVKATMTYDSGDTPQWRFKTLANQTDTFEADNCSIGEFEPTVVANVTDTTSWTPTGSWANATYTGKKWTSGDRAYYKVDMVMTGSGVGALTVNLPSGDTINTAKLNNGSGTYEPLGEVALYDASSAGNGRVLGNVLYSSTTSVGASAMSQASADPNVTYSITTGTPVTLVSGDVLSLKFNVPLSGLTSGTDTITGPAMPASQIRFYNDTSCDANTTSSSFTSLVDTDCDYATATKIGSTVTPTTTGGMALKIPSVPAGKYRVSYSGTLFANNSTNDECSFRLTDDTNIIGPTQVYTLTGSNRQFVSSFSGIVEYTSAQTNLEWKLQARAISGAGGCNARADSTDYSVTISMEPVSGVIAASLKGLPMGPYNLTVTGTNWTTTRATGVVYQMPDNSWRMRYNIAGGISPTATSITLSVTGVTFKNTANYYQSVTCNNTTITGAGYVQPGLDDIDCSFSSTSSRALTSGDVELESKPTFVP